MSPLLTVVLATTNDGKIAELLAVLGDLPVEFRSVKDVLGDRAPSVPEDGATFEANAEQKARAVSEASGLVALADDSGLEVDALGGRPGVRSARFAHERATDAENNAELIRELEEIEDDARSARFRCALALANPWTPDEVAVVEGRLDGAIARTPRGSGGFGYDSLFVLDGDGRAIAELTEQEKAEVSHRARAARAVRPLLVALVDAQLRQVEGLLGGP